MDHLKSSQERRDRWYSKLWPRFIPVNEAKDWNEALESQETYTCARSIPIDWLTKTPSNSKLQNVLQQHGFVVISGVLSNTECQEALKLGWDYLEAASGAESLLYDGDDSSKRLPSDDPPLIRNDASTHTKENMPRSVEGGMLPYYGSGHSTLAWFVRSHPSVVNVFSSLHGTDDLISSLDGLVLWFKQHQTDAGWFHIDQHPIHKPEPCSVQGLVNLLPVTSGTGGNALVANSHSQFPQHYVKDNSDCFYRERMAEIGTDDWLEIDPNDTELLQPPNLLSLLLSPGDLLLWDSRTVHCSYPAKQDESMPEFGNDAYSLIRAGVMVSMMPRHQVEESVLEQRIEAVHQSRTLTHWANKVAPLGEERPDQVALEARCVKNMREWQAQQGKPVLLAYNDLTRQQQSLVRGTR